MKITKRQLAAYVEAHGFNASPVSVWPRLNKAAEGGIQHFVSVDNGAYYAELWGRGGSYYAVTGAGVYQMPGLAKGAKLEEALDVFLEKVVGKRQDGVPLSALRKMAVDVAAEVENLEKQKPSPDWRTHPTVRWPETRPAPKSAPSRESLPPSWKPPTTRTSPARKRRLGFGPTSEKQSAPSGSIKRPSPRGRPLTGPGAPGQPKSLEKHEAPQEHGPHPHGGPPTAPPNWKPKKLIGGTSSHQRAAERHFAGQTPAPITKDTYDPNKLRTTQGGPPGQHRHEGASESHPVTQRHPASRSFTPHTEVQPLAKDAGIPKPKASTPPVSPPTAPASPPRSSSPREPHTEFSPQSTSQGPRGMGSRGGYSPRKTHAQYRGSPTARDRRELEKENMPSSIPVSTEPVAKAEPATSKPMTHWHGEHQHTHPNEGPHSHGSDAVVVTPPTTDEKLRSQRAVPGTRVPRQFSHVRRAVTDTPMRGGDTPHGGQVHGHLGEGGVTHSHTYGTHATATPLSMKPKPEDRTPGRYGSGYSEHERRFGHAASDLRRAENETPLNDMQYLAKRQETRVDLINKTAPIIEKDRTYLKPGEDAPEGSDTETGPRGGKYYETYEHGKAGPTKGGKWSRGSVEDWLWDQDIHADHISKHPDGTFSMKRAFYYKFGQSAGKFAEKIKAAGGEIISAEDQERQWPKTSYFVVRFKPPTGK